MSLCPAVTGKHFGFILTGCGTTNLGSFGVGWNCACPPLSWEPVQGAGKAASELFSSWPWSRHAMCLESPGFAHSENSVILFLHPDLRVILWEAYWRKTEHLDVASIYWAPCAKPAHRYAQEVRTLRCRAKLSEWHSLVMANKWLMKCIRERRTLIGQNWETG